MPTRKKKRPDEKGIKGKDREGAPKETTRKPEDVKRRKQEGSGRRGGTESWEKPGEH